MCDFAGQKNEAHISSPSRGFMAVLSNLRWFFRRLFRAPRQRNDIDTRTFPLGKRFWTGFAVFTLCILAIMTLVDAPTAELVRAIPKRVRKAFYFYTEIGRSAYILWATGLASLASLGIVFSQMARRRAVHLRHLFYDVFFMFYCVAISGLLAMTFKNFLGRARPPLMELLGEWHFSPFAIEWEFASFPSGHATTFGAVAAVLAFRFPRYWPAWLAIALTGAASRVILQVHYVSDVVAGLCLGAGLTWVTARYLAARGSMFRFVPGSMTPRRRMPGRRP